MSDSGKAVFLSYASQDAEAAKRICDALRAAGVEVWFDAEGGLEHGDEWDAKIRRQIRDCVLFLPIISANTQAREEGYFRIEWELAAQRALGIASGVAFILPIVIDDTREPDALVPDRFRSVQWTRLRGGELTPEVKARFLKLWSHRAGALKHEAAVGRDLRIPPSLGQAGFGDPVLQPQLAKPGWKVYAGLAAAIFTLVSVTGWWMLGRPDPVVSPTLPVAAPGPGKAASAPAPTETRLLVEKARALIDALDSVRDDYRLAEELVTQAKARDASDAEVWAVEAQVNQRFLQRGWDTSDARRESARLATQRALRLDSRSFEVRFAQQGLLAYTGREGAEKERLLRELRQERPADHRVLRELGSTIDRLGRKEEGIAFMDEAAALPGGDPLALYNKSMTYWFAGRTVEAEAALQAALAQRPFTSALLIGGWYAMVLHGDLAGARAILERVSPVELQEDRGCFFTYYLHLLAREPDEALARLRAVPRDWISDNWYRGPKGRLAGDALHMAGRTEAAAVEWRAALKLVDARLATDPTNGNLQYNRILLLVKLGEKPAAEQQFAVLVQLNGIDPNATAPVPGWVTDICVELGRKADAIRQISIGLKRERHAVDYTAATLRLDPQFDTLRGDPDFQKLLAEAEAVEKAAVVAVTPPRDWPKDPELKKVVAIVTALDASVESCRLAEDMVNAVLKQRPTDPETTVVYAMLNNYFLNRGYDASEERFVLARRFAERALQLAPEEPEALTAMGQFLTFRGADFARAEELVRRAMALAPQESRFARILAYNVLRTTNLPKALEQAKANVARFPGDALTHYDLALICRGAGELELMEQALDRAITLAPIGSAMIWKGWLAAWVHGDLPGFKSWLDRISGNFRYNERAVYMRYLYASLSGDTAYGLDAVRSYTGTWMSDFYYIGPRSLLLADLLALQGKADLAREEYGRALVEIDRVAQRSPEDTSWERAKFWALRGAGRTDEARVAAKRMVERLGRPYRLVIMFWWHDPIPAQLLAGDRADALALIGEATRTPVVRAQIRTALKIDHRMAPFRDDPEIKAMLAEPAEQRTEDGGRKTAKTPGGGP